MSLKVEKLFRIYVLFLYLKVKTNYKKVEHNLPPIAFRLYVLFLYLKVKTNKEVEDNFQHTQARMRRR